MSRPTICLNMIVKNESHVIARCLSAARPLVDAWCIVDTGSSDGTQARVRELMVGLPGTLHERPWRDFGHNRSEALELARAQGCDYLLFIDADEWFDVPPGFAWSPLAADGYELPCDYAGVTYARCALVATRLPWRWEGVLHEYLTCEPAHELAALAQPRIVVHHDGARARDPDTYLKDIALLEAALTEQPDNARNVYYLAQSLRDAGRMDEARTVYLRRAGMGGWDEEAWHALYQAAVLLDRLQGPPAEVKVAYLAAFEARPTRAEPLVALARWHRERQEYAQAGLYAQWASGMPQPADRLFVETAAYQWRALDELAVSGFYARSPEWQAAGRAALQRLLGMLDRLPADAQARVCANAGYYGL